MSKTTTDRPPILIGHLADIHLQEMQYASTARGEAFFEAFKKAIRVFHEERADILVCAGDTFDTSRLGARQCQQFQEVHDLLVELELPMLCVDGNHDLATPSWLDTLVKPNGTTGVIPITGRSYEFRGWKFAGWPALYADQYLDPPTRSALDADADVVIFHALVEGVVEAYFGNKKKITVTDLPTGGRIKAILLGDIHVPGYVRIDNTLIGYPGSLEMCKISEPVEKQLHLLRLGEQKAEVAKTIPFRNTQVIRLKIQAEQDMEAALAQVAMHPGAFVHVQFSPDVVNCGSRLMQAAAPGMTFAWSATAGSQLVADAASGAVTYVASSDTPPTLGEFIHDTQFADRPHVRDLCARLVAADDTEAATIVAAFIETQLI